MRQNSPPDRLRQMRENNLSIQQDGRQAASLPRKLTIAFENGSRMRFPYQFLMAEHYKSGDDEHLTLEFMSDTVKLKGMNLSAVFDYLEQEPPLITVTSERYIPVVTDQAFVVTEAEIIAPAEKKTEK